MDQTVSIQERNWGMFAHLSIFLGFIIPFGSIIAPFIIWQSKKQSFTFAAEHAKEALNFQISLWIYLILGIIIGIVHVLTNGNDGELLIVLGILIFLLEMIYNIIITIIAALKASNGQFFRYPLSIRFIRR